MKKSSWSKSDVRTKVTFLLRKFITARSLSTEKFRFAGIQLWFSGTLLAVKSKYKSGTYSWTDDEFAEFLYELGDGPEQVAEQIGENELFEVTIRRSKKKTEISALALDNIPSYRFRELLSEHIGMSCSRRVAMFNYLRKFGAGSMHYQEGVYRYGAPEEGEFSKIQILGRFYHVEKLWVWEWENSRPFIPDQCREFADRLRSIGHEENIAEFTRRSWKTDLFGCFQIAAVANRYDQAPIITHPMGECTVFILLEDPPAEALQPAPPQSMQQVVSEIDDVMPEDIDFRKMSLSYLRAEGFSIEETERMIIAICENDRNFEIEFTVTPKQRTKTTQANIWSDVDWNVYDNIWIPNTTPGER